MLELWIFVLFTLTNQGTLDGNASAFKTKTECTTEQRMVAKQLGTDDNFYLTQCFSLRYTPKRETPGHNEQN